MIDINHYDLRLLLTMKYREEKREQHEKRTNKVPNVSSRGHGVYFSLFFHVIDWIQKQECSIIHDDH